MKKYLFINNEFIISSYKSLKLYNKNLTTKKELNMEYSLFKNYVTCHKKLYKYDMHLNLTHICNINRNIYDILQTKNMILFMDVIGDIYKLPNNTDYTIPEEPELVTGTFSQPRGIFHLDELLYFADKHGRLIKTTLEGKIEDVYFTEEILHMIYYKNFIYLLQKTCLLIINTEFDVKKIIQFDEILQAPSYITIYSYNRHFNILIFSENTLYGLKNKELIPVFDSILDFYLSNEGNIYILDTRGNITLKRMESDTFLVKESDDKF